MATTVKAGQSFLDKVIEATGSIENAFKMGLKNNVSITSDLAIGTVLQSTEVTKKSIVAQWNSKRLPATALTAEQMAVIVPDEGIGAMIIEDSFIVY